MEPADPPLLALKQPINQQSLRYWQMLRGARRMPSWRDIDPVAIPDCLPHVIVLDVAHNPRDFRYRMIGTTVEYHMRGNQTGQWFRNNADKAPGSTIWSTVNTVVDTGLPVTSEIPYVGPHKDFTITEDVIMPLSDDDDLVNKLLVTVVYSPKADAASK